MRPGFEPQETPFKSLGEVAVGCESISNDIWRPALNCEGFVTNGPRVESRVVIGNLFSTPWDGPRVIVTPGLFKEDPYDSSQSEDCLR